LGKIVSAALRGLPAGELSIENARQRRLVEGVGVDEKTR
jgi:hypothetical protein